MTVIETQARSIFLAALERAPDQWPAFLDEACGSDADVRARVDQLLQAHQLMGSIHRGDPALLDVTVDHSIAERPGTVIGPYKLLEQIGEGGMGAVFMAEQTRPVRRKVALKVIKPGLDTRQVIARFEAERQALALMDHPNIAKVLDGGTTDTGRPYFVMELVKGIPITDYCDQHRLTTHQRLELFISVCRAVQHAHQKGVIHRDLKPSNVLVTVIDGAAVPKVIDFGVAKAAGGALTGRTLCTGFQQLVGTPLYMSPEQAALSGVDVDTRSDIYSLGVLLYELLIGTTPFDRETLRRAGYDEMRRIIREDEPPRPSTRLSTLEVAVLSTVAEKRGAEPRRLNTQLRGELDWIVMKALEKDRNRRYESASALATDLQRYLDDLPVLASPPSTTYRLRKALRRHRRPALAASITLFSLVAGIVGTTWGLVRAKEAWEAEAGQAVAERQAKESAQEREAETEAVLSFVEERILGAARPEGQEGGLGHEVQLRRAVEAALPFIANSFANQPLIEARLRRTIGQSLYYLSDSQKAVKQFEKAHALYTEHLGPDHPDTLGSMSNLAECYSNLGRHADSLKLNRELLALCRAKLGHEHVNTLGIMNNLARDYQDLGRYGDAFKLWEETLALMRANIPDHVFTLNCMLNLSYRYADSGRYADALKLQEEGLSLRKAKLGLNLSYRYADSGRYADALKLQEEGLSLRKAKLGPDHPDTLAHMNNLAVLYDRVGRQTDAMKLHEKALALQTARLGLDHQETLRTMANLADCYDDLGRHADAVKLHEKSLALRKAKLGPDHPDTLTSMSSLAKTFGRMGRQADAARLYKETLALRKAKLGPDHPNTLATMNDLANRYHAMGRHTEALQLHEQALALMRANIPDHVFTLNCMGNLASCYAEVGRYRDAIKLDEETLALRKAKLGPDHPDTLVTLRNLSLDYSQSARHADAIACCREVIRLKKDDARAHYTLGHALGANGQLDDAIAAYREAIRLKEDYAEAHTDLGGALQTKGRTDEAIACYRKAIRFKDAFRLRQDCALAHTKLGDSLGMKGQLDEAMASYQEAIHLNRGFADSHYNLGNILHGKGRLDEAIASFKEAIRVRPAFAEAHTNLGNTLRKQRRLDEAISCFQQAIRYKDRFVRKEECAIAHSNLGIALFCKGRWAEAEAAFRKALEVAPNNPDYKNNLAHFWVSCQEEKLRNVPQAVLLAKKASEAAPTNADCWGTLGMALYRAGRWQEALAALEKSVRQSHGGDAGDWFFLAMTHWQLAHKGKADDCFQKAVAWVDKHQPEDEASDRFRAEAAALLGIKEATVEVLPLPKLIEQ
jgi:tetratricopeptide (TPR) repeat protein